MSHLLDFSQVVSLESFKFFEPTRAIFSPGLSHRERNGKSGERGERAERARGEKLKVKAKTKSGRA